MTNELNADENAIRALISAGSEMAGGAGAGALGYYVGGAGGAAIGGATGPLLMRWLRGAAGEVVHRVLGEREKARVGATLGMAAQKIQENLNNGQQVRQDGFFEDRPGERAAGKEILEGVLLVAQREYQEKKLRFHANLLANIAFHQEIDRAQANLLIRVGEQISYRQMCLIALFANEGGHIGLREQKYEGANVSLGTAAVLHEVCDLCVRLLLVCSREAVMIPAWVNPSKMKVQGTGAMLYNLMELWRVDPVDVAEVAGLLR